MISENMFALSSLIKRVNVNPIRINECLKVLRTYIDEIKEYNLQLSAQAEMKISTKQRKSLQRETQAIHDFLRKFLRKRGLPAIVNKDLYCSILCDIMLAEEQTHEFKLATDDANLILKTISQQGDGQNPYFDVVFNKGFEDIGIQALYISTLNKYKALLDRGEDTTEIEKQLEEIIKHDENHVINAKSDYEILTSFFDSLSDRITEEYADQAPEEIMSRLLEKENIEELIKFIFPEGVYHEPIDKIDGGHDGISYDSEIPADMIGVERFRYIQKHFGISNIFIGKKSDKKDVAFSDCEGTFIIETANPDIVIVESFYEVHGDIVVESKDKATYILSKDYARELIDSNKGRAETRREVRNDESRQNFFRPVAHYRNAARYYGLLENAYGAIYDNMVKECAAKITEQLAKNMSPEEKAQKLNEMEDKARQMAVNEMMQRRKNAQEQSIVGKVDKMRQTPANESDAPDFGDGSDEANR